MSEYKELLGLAKEIFNNSKRHFKDYTGDYVCVGEEGKLYHVDEIHDLFLKVSSDEEDIAFQEKFKDMVAVTYNTEIRQYKLIEALKFDDQDTDYLYDLTRLDASQQEEYKELKKEVKK